MATATMPRSNLIAILALLAPFGAGSLPVAAYPTPAPADHGPFATSVVCALCHSHAPGAEAMRDAAGRPIAPYDLWSGTMMAQASRDPVWRAVVSAEVAATPSRAAEIEATCLRCHAPMAGEASPRVTRLDREDTEDARLQVAADGASCTVCHQILPEGLGTSESFGGGFRIGDDRKIFGPHEDVQPMPMLHHTGYRPTPSSHVLDPALCATCHTLFTEPLRADGRAAGGSLPEQTPWLEWRASAYGRTGATGSRSCQDCHMPTSDESGTAIETAIARNPGGGDFGFARPRRPFGQHRLVGGNYLVPSLVASDVAARRPAAAPETLEGVAVEARRMLGRAARVSIPSVERTADGLDVTVEVASLVGHKFPTGHPSRRAWVRLIVRDAEAAVRFVSGAFDPAGRLIGGDGRPMPSELAGGPVLPHRATIDDASQVQVYQSLMADADGRPTWALLRGHHYLKDNRLLPAGWLLPDEGAADVAPAGTAGDPDFTGGGDRIRYLVKLGGVRGALQIEADLFYQPLAPRYLAELFETDTPEVRRLAELWPTLDRAPARVARAVRALPPIVAAGSGSR